MCTLLNILWAIFGGGILAALGYFVAGLLFSVTIIGLPIGLQCFKMANLMLRPFGRKIIQTSEHPLGNEGVVLVNIIWFLVSGLWIALTHLSLAIASAVTIIGIPFAIQHLKFARLAISPFGRRIVELQPGETGLLGLPSVIG